ncbi:MAG TPA: hypothetical protein VKT53_00410 [Candidatus Acidoferrum sp.]|nr:hypothetical protein [Candidatus Acidoferrum sp.]
MATTRTDVGQEAGRCSCEEVGARGGDVGGRLGTVESGIGGGNAAAASKADTT